MNSRDDRVDLTLRVLLSALRPHLRSQTLARRLQAGALERAPSTTRIVMLRSRGAAMEFVEHEEYRPEQISIARCRELLGEEADLMTDQEVALIRRHAETMACVVVEMYQQRSCFPE